MARTRAGSALLGPGKKYSTAQDVLLRVCLAGALGAETTIHSSVPPTVNFEGKRRQVFFSGRFGAASASEPRAKCCAFTREIRNPCCVMYIASLVRTDEGNQNPILCAVEARRRAG